MGILAGTVLALLSTHAPNFFEVLFSPKNIPPYSFTSQLFFFWLSFYAIMFLLAYPSASSLTRLIFVTLIPSFLASLPLYWAVYNDNAQIFLIVILPFALNAFHIHYQKNGFHRSYSTLFYAVWNSIIKIMITLLVAWLAWLVLYLFGQLFDLINLHFLSRFISHSWVIVWINTLFITMSLYVVTQQADVVHNVRIFLLLIFKYLFIALVVMSITFVASLIVTAHYHTGDNIYIYTTMAFLSVFFLNAVYQDGGVEKPYPIFLLWICRFFILITPIFTFLVITQTHSTTLTPDNIPLQLLFFYNVMYALIAIVPQKKWFEPIEQTNIVLAILFIMVTLIITCPLFVTHFLSRVM